MILMIIEQSYLPELDITDKNHQELAQHQKNHQIPVKTRKLMC